jgi:hypothetical protein
MSLTQNGTLRVGTQTVRTTAISSGSLDFVEAQNDALPNVTQNKAERPGLDGSRNPTSRILTTKDCSIEIQTLVKGNGTVAAVSTPPVPAVEIEDLLDSLFGGTASKSAYSDTVTSSADNTDLDVGTFSAQPLAVGDGVLALESGTSNYQYRTITVASDPNYTIHAALVNETTGVAVGPATGGQPLIVGATWTFGSDEDHSFLQVERETETDLWRLLGCTVTQMGLEVPDDGGPLKFSFSLEGNDWSDSEAVTGTAYAASAGGEPILSADSPFFIDGDLYCARDFSLTFANGATKKVTPCGVNGFDGHKTVGPTVEASFSLYVGSGVGEAAKAYQTTLEAGTHDLVFQFGRTAGRAIGIRIPAADCSVTIGSVDGQDMLQVTAMGTSDSLAIMTLF